MVAKKTTRNHGYRHPRTGETRKQRKPLRIDRLGQDVKDAIIDARAAGKTWQRTAEVASAAAEMRLPRTSVQRWFELRVAQRPIGEALQEIIALLKDIRKAGEQMKQLQPNQPSPSPKQLNALLSLYNIASARSLICSSAQSEEGLRPSGFPPPERERGSIQLALPIFQKDNSREERLTWGSGIVGRELSSFTELRSDEAALLIDTLKRTLGQKVNPPSRRRPDRDQARAYGTAGRRGQSSNEIQLVDDATLELVADLVSQLGWSAERFQGFMRSRMSPVSSGAIRTLAEANRVIWALRNMLRKKDGNKFYRRTR